MPMRSGWHTRPDEGGAAADPHLVVLCYHAVSRDWDCLLAVHPDELEHQISAVLRRGYRPKTLAGAMSSPGSERTLVVTFDDAYRSVLTEGLPVLSSLNVPGTVFAPTDIATGGGLMTDSIPIPDEWVGSDEEMRCMDWEELRGLAGAGWEIGSHTCSHPNLAEIEPEAVAMELSRSRLACEEGMRQPCRSVAYPFGAWNEGVVEEAAAVGYEFGVTLGDRLLGPLRGASALQIPRDGVYRSTKRWEYALAISPALRRIRSLGAFSRFSTPV
jgi:peptidoglycan/xylan/chitin deacetylase (PgdA/CDA1 family)